MAGRLRLQEDTTHSPSCPWASQKRFVHYCPVEDRMEALQRTEHRATASSDVPLLGISPKIKNRDLKRCLHTQDSGLLQARRAHSQAVFPCPQSQATAVSHYFPKLT